MMSLTSHLEELQRKHGDLDKQIVQATASPSSSDAEILSLKRRKLALKDEIAKLKVAHTTH